MLLHHRFIQTAKVNKNKLAIVDGMTGKKLTFKQTLIASLMLAKDISRFHDKYFGIMLPNSAGCFISILACLFEGKVPVMINYSTGAKINIDYARDKCRFKYIITSRKLIKKIDCPELDGMIFLEDLFNRFNFIDKLFAKVKSLLPYQQLLNQVASGHENDTVVILFTSGSEKLPKGVELSHRNISFNLDAVFSFVGLTNKESITAILPVFHVFGFTTGLWLPLLMGMKVLTYGNPLEARKIVQMVKREQISTLIGTPFFLMNYARVASKDDFKQLRYVMSGADKTPESLFQLYKDKFSLDIIEGYGATETSPIISANPPNAIKQGSIGKPINGVEVKIVDLINNHSLRSGEEGKILVKGDLLMKGYFDDDAETSEKIQDGWYETGDMGLIDKDGYLWHKGRLKRFVKIGGEMVSLVKIESEIERLLPKEVECCVVEHPDEKKGSRIVVVTNKVIDSTLIRRELTSVLSAIEIPKQFMVLGELPKMGSGKVDFRKTTELSMEIDESEPA